MTQNDRGEIRDMIHGILEGWQEATIQRENLVHQSLNSIDRRLDKINGTILDHNKSITELKRTDDLHIVNCPVMPRFEAMDKNLAEYNFIKNNPKIMLIVLAVVVSGLIISAIGTIKSISNSTKSTEIRKSVDGIRYELAPERSAKPVPFDPDEVIKRMK